MALTGEYNVDIVICIDATASMHSAIDTTKENALKFHSILVEEMGKAQKNVAQLRIKVIVFRDYGCDSEPMTETEFFELPAQNDAFRDYVDGITVCGGGDGPENALEAIALALKSDWTTAPGKRRHVILVYTDNEALQLGERAGAPGYPTDLPTDLAGLGAWWEKTDQSFSSNFSSAAGRLVVFAPRCYPWNEEGIELWNRVAIAETKLGGGVEDYTFEEVIAFLVASI